jgi:hypothetical protein
MQCIAPYARTRNKVPPNPLSWKQMGAAISKETQDETEMRVMDEKRGPKGIMPNATIGDCSHDAAVFVLSVLPTLLQLALIAHCWDAGLTRCCCLDDSKPLLCSLVSVIRGFDIPDVCFGRPAPSRSIPPGATRATLETVSTLGILGTLGLKSPYRYPARTFRDPALRTRWAPS